MNYVDQMRPHRKIRLVEVLRMLHVKLFSNLVRCFPIMRLELYRQLLSVFGVVLMLLVSAVSLIMTWTSEEMTSPADLPMFAPLMWIAIGIFTGTHLRFLMPVCV